jgi:hypothetical protein
MAYPNNPQWQQPPAPQNYRRPSKLSPGLVAIGAVAACIVLLVAGAYLFRASVVGGIEDTVNQWHRADDAPDEATGRQIRNAVTCATEQLPPPSPTGNQNPDPYNMGTVLSHSFHIDHIYVGLGLDTAWVVTTEHYVHSKSGSQMYQLGFQVVKEQGAWKVCKWDSDASYGLWRDKRTLLLGWELSGPP